MKVFSGGIFCHSNLASTLLILIATIMMFYFLERCLFLHSRKVNARSFMDGILSLLTKNRVNDAIKVCDEAPGTVPAIVKAAILHKEDSIEEIKFAISNVAMMNIPILERRLNSIRLLSKIAPLVGFIGTLGVFCEMLAHINATAIYSSASGAIGYIQRAINIVAAGLIINIFGILAYNLLRGRVVRLVYNMEIAGNEILSFLASKKSEKCH